VDEIGVQIDFTDVTLAEADGIFEDVKELMTEEAPNDDTWMLRTSATITSVFGVGMMVLHFYGTGKILIDDYNPSTHDVYYNPDVRALCDWAKEAGWTTIQPSVDIIKKNKDFWRYFWDTFIIDSDYFDKVYGSRDIMEGQ
jgi:hypothetical protein